MSDEARTVLGEIQLGAMRAVWRTGGGTVEDIRAAMPADYESSYNTVQTMLNRLAERGLLERTPGQTPRGPGGKIVYTPTLSEGDYLVESIRRTLAAASPEARHLAITHLMGQLDDGDTAGGRKKKKNKKNKARS